ncbi:MAG: hypothetical protein LBH90_04150 [Tannerella sp.]|jgi:hypothetical protein|nr:hypothetical protein [Tannerella sp.]
MATNSFILAKQHDGVEAVLFEGSSSLPFFWLMLLDETDINLYREKISQLSGQEPHPFNTYIALDKLKAIARATKRRDYVKLYYKNCIPLFDDWIYFMQISDFYDRKIYMDLYHASQCYPVPDDFISSLLKAVACFDELKEAWYEETIAGTCGYDGRHKNKRRFNEFSDAYQELNRKNIYDKFEKKVHLGKRNSVKKKSVLIFFCIFLAILSALFFFFR